MNSLTPWENVFSTRVSEPITVCISGVKWEYCYIGESDDTRLTKHFLGFNFDFNPPPFLHTATRHSFGDVLFHGCEWSLFQLDLLLFGIIDVVSNSYPLAAVITLLVSWVSETTIIKLHVYRKYYTAD